MKKPSLKILDIFIGNRCNLACEQCDTRSDVFRKDKSKDPSFSEICESIILADKYFEVETYSTLGGEPLLFFDFTEKVIKFIREINSEARIVFSTNGMLIPKYLEKIVKLVDECDVSIGITDHFAGFEDKKLSNQINQNVLKLVDALGYDKIDGVKFFKEWLNLESYDQDKNWDRFLKNRPNFLEGHENNIAFGTKDKWIWFHPQSHFQAHYYRDEHGSPKPFITNDSKGSYFRGCCSMFCSFMNKGKIYKCAPLGTLENFLSKENVLEDKDWEKYLSYTPLDLKNCTQQDIEDFSNNKFRESDMCDMCPNSGNNYFLKTPDKVLPKKIIFK